MMYDGYDPYAPDPDEEWRYNQGRTAVPKSAPPTTAPWTDPDNTPPAWLYDGNQHPVNDPGPGNYWAFDGAMWTIRTGPRPQTTPPPGGGGGDLYGGGGGGGDSYGGGYQAPDRTSLASLNYPSLNLPRMQAPPPFAYQDYTSPTREQAESEPGFDYALKQGIKAYENSKAYTGTYKGGATIKGINDYARNMATQNYGQVDERQYRNWSGNRANAADSYMTNYGVSRDVFDRNSGAVKDEFAPRARSAELEYARDWDVFAYEGDDKYRWRKMFIDANT